MSHHLETMVEARAITFIGISLGNHHSRDSDASIHCESFQGFLGVVRNGFRPLYF